MMIFIPLALATEKSRELAIAVGAAHMAQKEGWAVKKCLKSVLVAGTTLFVLWSDQDKKSNPKTTFKGTLRIASVQYVANGFTFLVYKDNGARKVANADMEHMVSFSNTILDSKQAGHIEAKEAAVAERLCPAFDPDASDSDISDEEDGEEDDEDSENEKDKRSAEDSKKIVGPEQAGKTSDNATTEPEKDPGKETPSGIEASGTASTQNIPEIAADARQEGEPSASLALGNGGYDAPASTPTSDKTLPSGIQAPNLPSGSLPNTLRELREMESLLKAKKKLVSNMRKQEALTDDKTRTKKLLEEQLKALKTEAKTAKAEAKLKESVRTAGKRRRDDDDANNRDDEGSDDFDLFKRPEKRVLTTVDKWQKGHRRAALCAARNKLVENVTCSSWEEAYGNLCEHGWAVVNNWADLVHPACRPDAEQRDYILTCTCTIHFYITLAYYP